MDAGLDSFLRAIEALGPTGVMALFLYFFLTGKLVSRHTIDAIIPEISARIIAGVDDIMERRMRELEDRMAGRGGRDVW